MGHQKHHWYQATNNLDLYFQMSVFLFPPIRNNKKKNNPWRLCSFTDKCGSNLISPVDLEVITKIVIC